MTSLEVKIDLFRSAVRAGIWSFNHSKPELRKVRWKIEGELTEFIIHSIVSVRIFADKFINKGDLSTIQNASIVGILSQILSVLFALILFLKIWSILGSFRNFGTIQKKSPVNIITLRTFDTNWVIFFLIVNQLDSLWSVKAWVLLFINSQPKFLAVNKVKTEYTMSPVFSNVRKAHRAATKF